MLNAQLSILGLSEEWRPAGYHSLARTRIDSEIYLNSDPVMLNLLADCNSPKLDLWRAVLRLWRGAREYQLAYKAEAAMHGSRRNRGSTLIKTVYAFDHQGRHYQISLNNNDFEIVRKLGLGVTMKDYQIRIKRMNPPQTIFQTLPGRKLNEVVEMEHQDLADYGEAIITKAQQRGQNLFLKIDGDPKLLHKWFDFAAIEPLLEKQDKKQARKSA